MDIKDVTAVCVAVAAISGFVWLLTRPAPPVDSRKLWVDKQYARCRAMASRGVFDEDTARFECWRSPLARYPKLMFKETYGS
jgi:hypothetical protein